MILTDELYVISSLCLLLAVLYTFILMLTWSLAGVTPFGIFKKTSGP